MHDSLLEPQDLPQEFPVQTVPKEGTAVAHLKGKPILHPEADSMEPLLVSRFLCLLSLAKCWTYRTETSCEHFLQWNCISSSLELPWEALVSPFPFSNLRT